MNAAFLCLIPALLAGAASTLLELLWLRAAGAALPGTVPAGSLVLPAFLLAWTLGSTVAGRRADRAPRPLALAARWLAAGAGCAVLAPWALAALAPDPPPASELARLCLGGVPVLPAAFCLGGALPLLARLRRSAGLEPARATGLVAAAVAAGGLLGCLGLVPVMQLAGTATTPAAGCLAVAALACLFLSCFETARTSAAAAQAAGAPGAAPAPAAPARPRTLARLLGLCAFSGGVMLVAGQLGALRVAAQFRGDSLATTAEVLGALHAGMALGALTLAWLGSRGPVRAQVGVLLALAGAGLALPALALGWLSRQEAWTCALALAFPLGLGAGSLVTAASRAAARPASGFGSWVGDLAALSTAGGLAGGLAYTWWWMPAPWGGTGPVLAGLSWAGAALAAVLAAGLVLGRRPRRLAGLLVAGAAAAALWVAALAGPLDLTSLPLAPDETGVLAAVEGPHGVITLASTADGGTRLTLNHRFSLGGTRGALLQRRLGRIAASFRPDARRALLLGMGRGHALAGLAGTTPARVTCVERNAQILALGLGVPFEAGTIPPGGPPAIEHGDARAHLLQHPASYDLIVGDLFFPWVTGAGDLLAEEQFAAMRRALAPDGVALQWLPLHQLPWPAFGTVVQAFLEQFPRGRLFLAQPLANEPLVALVGGLAQGLPDGERVDALLAASPSDAGPHGAADVLDLHLADFWTLRERFAGVPAARWAAPLSELGSLRRERDETLLARLNTRLLADLVQPLNTSDLAGRPLDDEQDRALGVRLQARALALQALLLARAAHLELLHVPAASQPPEQREALERRLDGALLAGWRAAPGHLGLRQALIERVGTLTRQQQREEAAVLLESARQAWAEPLLEGVFGGLLLQLGQAGRALQVLTEARSRQPGERTVLLNLGTAYCFAERDEEALEAWRVAREAGLPGQMPLLQRTALGLLERRPAAADVARTLLEGLDRAEPWAACLRRLLEAGG